MKDAGLGVLPAPGRWSSSFTLESGHVLRDVVVAYSTYGVLNPAGDNGVIVGHSLTSNSCVHEWWGEMLRLGPGFCLDVDRDFVVCANYLGSPYGTSSPSPRPVQTGRPMVRRRLPQPVHHPRQRPPAAHAPGPPRRPQPAPRHRWKHGVHARARVRRLHRLRARTRARRRLRAPHGLGHRHRRGGAFRHHGGRKVGGRGLRPERSPQGWSRGGAHDCDADISRASVGGRSTRPRDHLVGHQSTRVETDAARRSRRDGARQRVGDGRAAALRGGELSAYQGLFCRRSDPNCYVQLTCTLDSHDVSRGRGEQPRTSCAA